MKLDDIALLEHAQNGNREASRSWSAVTESQYTALATVSSVTKRTLRMLAKRLSSVLTKLETSRSMFLTDLTAR